MYEFMLFILQEVKKSFSLVLVLVVVTLAAFIAMFFIRKRKGASFPWKKALLILLLAGYTGALIYATKFRYGEYRSVNLHLFRAWREAWNNYSARHWANVLLNVALFLPLGGLLPPLTRKFRKWYITLPLCFGVSLILETMQLLLACGVFDVDDLFTNTLGALMGYLMSMTILSIGKNRRGVLIHGSLLLSLVAAISSIFLVYEIKEYGNLPMAPAYTINTRKVQWQLKCTLPETNDDVPVYQTRTRTLEECDAFADGFKQIINTEYDTVSYYQNAACYMDHGADENGAHFLYVNYKNPGYTYSRLSQDDPAWADADRDAVEAVLAKYSLFLPDYAVFSAEGEGWYSFTVSQHIDGANMTDGILRCRYGADGTIYEIENTLLQYNYHSKVEIISAQEAFDWLCEGHFYDGGYFENEAPSNVSVINCSLEYTIDTKGFYQPVYYFDVTSNNSSYKDRIMIPAMK